MNKKSFTLIEILVVIVIIGIISAFIIVSMAGVSDKARIAKGQAFSSSLKNALLANLVSEWKFSGPTVAGSPVTVDDIKDSFGTKDCAINGVAPTIRSGSDCISGSCVDFDRENDGYLSCGNLGTMSSFTLNLWAKKNTAGDYNCFSEGATGWSSGFHFWANGNAIMSRVGNDTAGINMASTYSFGTSWNNIVFVVDRNVTPALQKLYVNSSLVNSLDISSIVGNINLSAFKIGFSSGNSSPLNEYRGKIDEVRVYNESLPASRVRENYYSGLNKLLAQSGILSMEYAERISRLINNLGELD
ncbi:MAG: LamG-like jellyroll fold domain-containing protein [Candidatus Paceibacterota bacterium]|jgi:prepilin-type N-terminal cleavage/methylation domain-containing protein|nr:prepilin-type N-terminal cleavage/methylation domain-containing protein [Candidatus Paceibacterota bacterium]MDD5555337.1 prepilin-type N-terminal cleavage/methylation domain-containing protein [Candidatus Paceibacterota bacterium]